MSPAATPPPTRRRSPLWYVTVFGLVAIVGLIGVFGALHWYTGYARSLAPVVMVPRVLDKTGAAEKKAEKPSGGAKAGAGDQADTSETVGSHKSNAKPTVTSGA